MPPCGRSWPSPVLGDGDKAAGIVLRCSIRSTTPARRADVQRYKVEPYVVAADVYAAPPHVGRGGWTWYTGSAGWMYRAGAREHPWASRLRAAPCVSIPAFPRSWPGFEMRLRHRRTRYDIDRKPRGVSRGSVHARARRRGADRRIKLRFR